MDRHECVHSDVYVSRHYELVAGSADNRNWQSHCFDTFDP